MGYLEEYSVYLPMDRQQVFDAVKNVNRQQIKDAIRSIDIKTVVKIYLAYYVVRKLVLYTYNIFFHPLRNYPGPFVAKFSSLYEFYWDLIQDGQMSIHIAEDLHPTYGDFVRVGPNRVAAKTLKAFNDIHYVGSPFLKDPYLYGSFGLDGATFGQIDPHAHRERRQYLSPMFSKKAVMRFDGLVREKMHLLMKRFRQDVDKTGTDTAVINVYHPYGALTSDISMVFSLGGTYNLLERADYNDAFMDALDDTMYGFWWMKHFRFLITLSKSIPPHILGKLMPGVAGITRMGTMAQVHIEEHFRQLQEGTVKEKEGDVPIVFRELLKTLPPKWANPEFLFTESVSVFGAGLHTSRWIMVSFAYHIGKYQDCQKKLLEELKTVWPNIDDDIPPISTLENLPYLTGVVKESLRIGLGVSGELARAVPKGGATVDGHWFPEGVVIDQSPVVLHRNKEAFPNPEIFDPERWVDPADRKKLDKYIACFGGGSRICLGLHLAYMELYYLMAIQVRKFELKLTEKFEREGLQWKERWMMAPTNDPLPMILTVRKE